MAALKKTRSKRMVDLAGSGDDGTTGLLGGGRVEKDDARIEAYGTIDEASSAIGLAKSLTSDARVREICEEAQRGLYRVGAELATNPKSRVQFAATGKAEVERIAELMTELETAVSMPDGFILPGSTPASAALDVARAVTRRAERRCLSMERVTGAAKPFVRQWLNRLSLLLFVLARYEEAKAGKVAKAARARPF